MMDHPYSTLPERAFWSRSVSRGFEAADVSNRGEVLICRGEKVVSAGSCFASNLVPYLEKAGFAYVRTEAVHPSFRKIPPENLGYGKFSANYGNIYTVRQMLQLVRRSMGAFRPVEDRWPAADGVVDPFRPGLRYKARSDREFDLLTAKHLAAARAAFAQADVFVFTLGLTEAWVSRADGAVFPACPGTVAGEYDPQKHSFVNFGVAEIVADLDQLIAELRSINPRLRVVLTVSPVPLVATAGGSHVLAATTYSKSVLRVAAEHAARNNPAVAYFPAYEIVTGPQAPYEYFEPDRRNVSAAAVEAVMAAFLANCQLPASAPAAVEAPAAAPVPMPEPANLAAELGRYITAAECEEAMADTRSVA
jgi:hypothetical protein